MICLWGVWVHPRFDLLSVYVICLLLYLSGDWWCVRYTSFTLSESWSLYTGLFYYIGMLWYYLLSGLVIDSCFPLFYNFIVSFPYFFSFVLIPFLTPFALICIGMICILDFICTTLYYCFCYRYICSLSSRSSAAFLFLRQVLVGSWEWVKSTFGLRRFDSYSGLELTRSYIVLELVFIGSFICNLVISVFQL